MLELGRQDDEWVEVLAGLQPGARYVSTNSYVIKADIVGRLVANDSDSYQYLAESIRMHPDQETLVGMMQDAGFERCRFNNLTAGIVALQGVALENFFIALILLGLGWNFGFIGATTMLVGGLRALRQHDLKLLLAHGTMDSNVPFYNTLLVVNELIAANKDFDFILFPNRRHGFSGEPYMMRRRWDYFVKHLLGAEPPKEFVMGG